MIAGEHSGDEYKTLRVIKCPFATLNWLTYFRGLPDGYRMNKPSIYFTPVPFAHARSALGPSEKASSCNDCT